MEQESMFTSLTLESGLLFPSYYLVLESDCSRHTEFAGRAIPAYSAVSKESPYDCYGHGTHVAGIVGAETVGVAREVTLYGVKVLNCRGKGNVANVISAVKWVLRHHSRRPATHRNSIVNISLGTCSPVIPHSKDKEALLTWPWIQQYLNSLTPISPLSPLLGMEQFELVARVPVG